jgi:hypothetical protein
MLPIAQPPELFDEALAHSSDRYGKFDWWSPDVGNPGYKSDVIQTPAIITPLLCWL